MSEKPDDPTGTPQANDPVSADPAAAAVDPPASASGAGVGGSSDPSDSLDAPSPDDAAAPAPPSDAAATAATPLPPPPPPPPPAAGRPPYAASSVGPPFGPPVAGPTDDTAKFGSGAGNSTSPLSSTSTTTTTTTSSATPHPSPPTPEPTSLSDNPSGLRRKGRDPRRVGLGVAMAGLALASGVTGAVGAVTLADDDDNSSNSIAETQSQFDTASEQNEQPTPDEPLSQAAAKVLPSVVSITTSDGQMTGEGSGVIISDDGLVLTNNHVVSTAGEGGEVDVTISDGTSTTAEVVGTDPASDLAVIQLENAAELDITPAELGDSSDLVVGDTVLAIGAPLGLDGSVSAGIVSALERAIVLAPESAQDPFGQQEQEEESSSSSTAVITAIQTDAAINPGNSGGPLVNSDGQVVGVNTAIASLAGGLGTQGGNIGLGFAIPIDDARAIAEQLANGEEVTHAYLGVQVGDSTDAHGAVIGEVESASPADQAGLESGDIVTAIDGENVADSTGLTATIRSHQPGDKVSLTVQRDDEELTIEATLGELE